jgi:hypothetical protein
MRHDRPVQREPVPARTSSSSGGKSQHIFPVVGDDERSPARLGLGQPGRAVSRSVAPGSLAGFRVRASALSARRDGPDLQVAGSIPVDLAYWGIRDPAGAGVLGSLADHGEAEFRLTLTRR